MGKNPWRHNGEGYIDRTASEALQHVSKEERKIVMAKRRSCRRTTDEHVIHEKAVKMRKKTDEQLLHYIEDRVRKAHSEGYNRGKSDTPKSRTFKIGAIINEIGDVKGIGATKLQDIRAILEKHLEMDADA